MRLSCPIRALQQRYDVVVIGSGYGGAIAASRLARAGKTVCVLERGREYAEGDFPGGASDHAANQVVTALGRIGATDGLYQVHAHGDVRVGLGCGLGGGSLVNAGILMRPDPRVLAHARWPQAIRRDVAGELDSYYELAGRMLKPSLYPDGSPPLLKHKAFHKAATKSGAPAKLLPMAVNFASGKNHVGVHQRTCVLCGECGAGCNHGAKNTLYMNYLPDAKQHGAELFTGIQVQSVERQGERWIVRYELIGANRERFAAPAMWLSAKIVVLAAGALGSTEILLRSRDRGLALSEQLGRSFSSNGNYLGVTGGATYKTKLKGQGRAPDRKAPTGPSITSIIDHRGGVDFEDGFVIEDFSYPSFSGRTDLQLVSMATIWFGLLAGLGLSVGDFDREEPSAGGFIHRLRMLVSNLQQRGDETFKWAMVWLLMSHDEAGGQLVLDGSRLRIVWPQKSRRRYSVRHDSHLEELSASIGGTYFRYGNGFTNHPLGGCPMADDAADGVVNHAGEVFASAVGDHTHDGLYVCDGAIVPRSLGINPLWTISALAERCVKLLADKQGWHIDYTLPYTVRA